MDTEEEARKAWARPRRGDDRIDVTIDGSRVWVCCKGDVVRVVVQREDGGSQVETDLVRSVEVKLWRRGSDHLECPPQDDGQDSIPRRARRSSSG
jgi:outer membrane protein assembly factor BamB